MSPASITFLALPMSTDAFADHRRGDRPDNLPDGDGRCHARARARRNCRQAAEIVGKFLLIGIGAAILYEHLTPQHSDMTRTMQQKQIMRHMPAT